MDGVTPVPGTTGPPIVPSLGVAANTLPYLSATHRNDVDGLSEVISAPEPAEGSGRHNAGATPRTVPAGGSPGQAFSGSSSARRCVAYSLRQTVLSEERLRIQDRRNTPRDPPRRALRPRSAREHKRWNCVLSRRGRGLPGCSAPPAPSVPATMRRSRRGRSHGTAIGTVLRSWHGMTPNRGRPTSRRFRVGAARSPPRYRPCRMRRARRLSRLSWWPHHVPRRPYTASSARDLLV